MAFIEAARTTFQARGRPLAPDAIDDLARAWLHHWDEIRRSEQVEVTVSAWAAIALLDLHFRDPRGAIAVLARALELDPGEDTEFNVFEELQPLVREHGEFVRTHLPAFLLSHPALRMRLEAICAGDRRPYGWTDELWKRLCECR